jgi:glycopeptide antibiotics resistance protein
LIVLSHSRTISPTTWLLLWTLYACLIVWSGVYHTNFVAHGHWEFLKWIPPIEEVQTIGFWADIVINILLYVPFALLYLQRSLSVTRSTVITVMLLGLLLSCTIELYQLYSHNRRAALSDILCNVAGTWAGVLIRKKWWMG